MGVVRSLLILVGDGDIHIMVGDILTMAGDTPIMAGVIIRPITQDIRDTIRQFMLTQMIINMAKEEKAAPMFREMM